VLLATSIFPGSPVDSARADPPARRLVSRIVAIVDRDVITSVQLKRRARPFQLQIDKQLGTVLTATTAAASSEMLRDLLKRMIDERLVARAAAKADITVSASEIDAAVQQLAKAQGIDAAALLSLALQSGLNEADYREELSRQILEGKVIMRLAKPRTGWAKLPEAEQTKVMSAARDALVERLRRDAFVEVRL
jgi:peptidyl-prolyl cis-trans isomerase SurA